MNIEIWSVGRPNEDYIEAGVANYLKKTEPWCNVSLHILQLPKKLATTDPVRTKSLEEDLILRRLLPQHHLILLDERGQSLHSEDWAKKFQQMMNTSVRTSVLLIGGAFGVSDKVRASARQVWSLSPLVFPHQLVRLIVSEQIYRAFSIINNSLYHHT